METTAATVDPHGGGILIATINGIPVYGWPGQSYVVSVPMWMLERKLFAMPIADGK